MKIQTSAGPRGSGAFSVRTANPFAASQFLDRDLRSARLRPTRPLTLRFCIGPLLERALGEAGLV